MTYLRYYSGQVYFTPSLRGGVGIDGFQGFSDLTTRKTRGLFPKGEQGGKGFPGHWSHEGRL